MGSKVGKVLGAIAIGVAIGMTGGMAAVVLGAGQLLAGGVMIAAGIGAAVASFASMSSKSDVVTPANPQQQSHIFKGTTTAQKVIYGAVRVSGPMYEVAASGNLTPLQQTQVMSGVVVAKTTTPVVSSDYLHVIIPLAGHEVYSIGNIIVNNELVSAGTGGTLTVDESAQVAKYKSWIRVNRHLGGHNQVADPDLVAEVPEWTSSHIGAGIAYIYLRLKYNRSLYPQGIRNIQADVLGKKVYDPESGATTWSDNWALCVRDYMSSPLGLNMSSAEIDDTYIIAAKHISDEVIPTANNGSQSRYTCNGTMDLAKNPLTLLKSILTAGAGSLIPSVEGKARLIPGAYSTAVLRLGESDLRGGYTYNPSLGSKSRVNTLIGQYSGPDSSWVRVSFPQVGVQAYVDADGGVIQREIRLPFCTDHERCQRLAKLHLEFTRMSGVLHMPCKLTALEAATMDVIMVTLPELGFVDKTFRVIKWSLSADLGVDLVLKEDDPSVYAWQQSDATPFNPTPTSLPDLPTGALSNIIPGTVTGLEVTGQANKTEFSGRDAHISWRNVSQSDYQAIGSEIFGANAGSLDTWFAWYEVQIVVNGVVIRTENVTTNSYVYTLEKNAHDLGGPHRSFGVAVSLVGKEGQKSRAATMVLYNPAPTIPIGLTYTGDIRSISVRFSKPTDTDWAGTELYISTTSGFIPGPSTLVYDGPDTTITVPNLVGGTQYYIVFRPYDAFGAAASQYSTEVAVATDVIKTADMDHIPPSDVVIGMSPTTGVNETAATPSSWVKFSWSAATDDSKLTGYEVEYWSDVDSTAISTVLPADSLSHTLTPLVPHRLYFFRVRAVDWGGNVSINWSSTLSLAAAGADITPPSDVVLDTPAMTSTLEEIGLMPTSSVSIRWLAATDPSYGIIAQYEVQYHTDTDATWVPVFTSGDQLGYTLRPASPGRTYTVRVRAIDGVGNKSVNWSAIGSIAATGKSVYSGSGAPALIITPGLQKVVVSWTLPTDADLLSVQIWSPGLPDVLLYEGLGTSFILADPAFGVMFKSAAKDIFGNVSPFSANSAIVTALKISPTNVAQVIAPSAIPSIAIANGAIIDAKLSTSAVTASKLALGAVTATALGVDSVTATALGVDSVTATAIAANAVTTTQIAAGAITANTIATGAVTANAIAANAVSATEIAANTITAGNISANAITATELATDSVTSVKIVANAITSTELSTDSVTANAIVAGSITATELAANSVTASEIAANSVDANAIVANTITSAELAANSVTANELSVTSLSAISANLGTLTSGSIIGATIATDSGAAGHQARIQMDSFTGLSSISSTGVITGRLRVDGSGFLGMGSIWWDPAGNLSVSAARVSGVLTGAYIRTAATGARISIDSTAGLQIVNSAGNLTGHIAVDGSGYFGSTSGISWDTAGTLTMDAANVTGTLTGAYIRTASSGAMLTLSSAGLSAVNAAGSVTANIAIDGSGFFGSTAGINWDAAGNVSLSGSVTAGAGSVIDGVHITNATIRTAHILNGSISSTVTSFINDFNGVTYSATLTYPATPAITLRIKHPEYGVYRTFYAWFWPLLTGVFGAASQTSYAMYFRQYARTNSAVADFSPGNFISDMFINSAIVAGYNADTVFMGGAPTTQFFLDIEVRLFIVTNVNPGIYTNSVRGVGQCIVR